jgi:hypothetical protein
MVDQADGAGRIVIEKHGSAPINGRQRDMLNRLLDGFEGNLTSSKWATIEKCSQDTALRDIDGLLKRGILIKDQAGAAAPITHWPKFSKTSQHIAPMAKRFSGADAACRCAGLGVERKDRFARIWSDIPF